ncbi:hypothetical protein MAPG_09538 [Magnaporthiopsis poae ATCC 64411]|uniref:Uncharacterized protein n=1 Tax=Magnaporthiopsis poae (strain ATCC 64411 / 73-15) TaxID=644358 RepID=A0A0C4EA79_MAGP6|nr:hypothetical protein MAPG_09538 [Magnaporthiopsis poae ATCC 64411]
MTPLVVYPEGGDKLGYMEKINLPFMYNLREGYRNLTYVEEKVRPAVDSEALYSYWTADEPDGWQHPFDAPGKARDVIRKLDPYHPVAVTLNCQDYYFGQYTDGADFIMEDVYPSSPTRPFQMGHRLQPHPRRLRLRQLRGRRARRRQPPRRPVPSFSGEGYWPRDPTPAESWAMNLLAFNHGATGIVAWLYPPSDTLAAAHGKLAKVVASAPVADFIIGNSNGNGGPNAVAVAGLGPDQIDVAYWTGADGKLLVSVVNPSEKQDRVGDVDIKLPRTAARIDSVPWGSKELWTLADDGKTLHAAGNFSAMSTAMILLALS